MICDSNCSHFLIHSHTYKWALGWLFCVTRCRLLLHLCITKLVLWRVWLSTWIKMHKCKDLNCCCFDQVHRHCCVMICMAYGANDRGWRKISIPVICSILLKFLMKIFEIYYGIDPLKPNWESFLNHNNLCRFTFAPWWACANYRQFINKAKQYFCMKS